MKWISFGYGFMLFLGLSGLFLVLVNIGLGEHYNLRMLNGVIHLLLLYHAIRNFRAGHPDLVHSPVSGLTVGTFTSFIGILPFVVFVGYYSGAHPEFIASLQQESPFGKMLTPLTISIVLFIEGMSVGIISSYVLTRLLIMRSPSVQSVEG